MQGGSMERTLGPNGISPVLLDHAEHPRNNGLLSDHDGHARITGPCGDTMEFWVRVRDGKVEKASFISDGCGSSHACGSMLTCLAEERPLSEVLDIGQEDILWAFGSMPAESEHCALLAADVLNAACRDYVDGDTAVVGTDRVLSESEATRDVVMRIAVPIVGGRLSPHFGHCENFALLDVDPSAQRVLKRWDVAAPAHQPGLLPPWLAERGTHVIICGGMGQRAQDLFSDQGICVVVGAPVDEPERLAADFLAKTLAVGENACDH